MWKMYVRNNFYAILVRNLREKCVSAIGAYAFLARIPSRIPVVGCDEMQEKFTKRCEKRNKSSRDHFLELLTLARLLAR